MTAETISLLIDQFTQRVNQNLLMYLPSVGKMVMEYESFIQKNKSSLEDNK